MKKNNQYKKPILISKMKNKNTAIRHRKEKKRLVMRPSEQALLQEIVQQVRARCEHIDDEDFWIDYQEAGDLANGGEYEEAMAFIDTFFKKYRRMPKHCRAHLYYLKGFTIHNRKGEDYKRALLYYNKAISLAPDPESVYYYDRGCLKGAMGNEEGKQRDFETGRRIDPVWFDE
jgi:tetratricopeptide (TPR) repeat protein